jgi:signal transduction histidine kinase
MNDMVHEFVGSRLEHDVESLLAAIEVQPDQTHDVLYLEKNRMPPVYQQPFSGHYFVITMNNSPSILSRSLWDQTLVIPKLTTGERILNVTDGPDNQKLLQINMGFNKKGKDLVIALAEDLTLINEQKTRFKTYFFILSLLGLMLLLLIQSIILRLSFKRLELVCSDIKCLDDGELLKLSENVPSEVLPLVQEVNHLLNLLEKRLERSRNALGNLSHALKSPLNLLIQYFYSSPDTANADQQAIHTIDAKKQLERINQLINRELKRARLAGKGSSTQRFNPKAEIPELIAVIKQIYSYRDLKINYRIDEQITNFGDREDMLELLGNLLDNAGKWANSEIGITILSCNKGENTESENIHIIIEDDGKSIDDSQLASLTQRGTRLDESVDGHGLGLSIVNDIVKLYAGTIKLEHSEKLGGLKINIHIDVN